MFFSPETKYGSEIMRKILIFASFEAQKFSPSFRFEVKITKSKRSKKFKAKKSEKSEIIKNRLEFCFVSFPFEVSQFRFIWLISEKFFLAKRAHPRCKVL
jgi:hypothetical protein